MKNRSRAGLALAAVLTGAVPLGAADLSFGRIAAGVFEANLAGSRAGELSAQYQGGLRTGPFHPVAGVMTTTDGAFHVFAGFGAEVPVTERLILRPTFCPGLFSRGHGKDLGAVFEFRSAIEVTFQLAAGKRIGLELDHVSNSGYGRSNRGEESLLVTFTLPFPRR